MSARKARSVDAAPEPRFALETDLCARFAAGVGEAWQPYTETAGWDILLVRKADGFQIGVQAKLRFNTDVVSQTLESGWWADRNGPDCRAVLVPGYVAIGGLDGICGYIGLTVIRCWPEGHPHCRWRASGFEPALPKARSDDWGEAWHELAPWRRCKLPAFVPDVVAGDKAPLRLTEWKIAALRVAAILELRGHVTRADFRLLKIDVRRWLTAQWLRAEDGRLVEGNMPAFRRQHPKVYAQILAEAPTWMAAHDAEVVTERLL